jgi:hypothetical protein
MNYLSYEFNPSRNHLRQVTDTCRFLEQTSGTAVRLIIFLPWARFRKNKGKVLDNHDRSWVIPMVFGPRRWRLNFYLLFIVAIFLNSGRMIGDGLIATTMALRLRKRGILRRVGFDAKTAYAAEWKHYRNIPFENVIGEAEQLERNAVLKSDYRVACSEQLVQHWRKSYGFNEGRVIVVPGTLASDTTLHLPDKGLLHESRSLQGFKEQDILLVCSGIGRGPKHGQVLDEWLVRMMDSDPRLKIIFVTEHDVTGLKVMVKYPARIKQENPRSSKLAKLLATGDYGVMLRDDSLANAVASPPQVGEYLTCGLPVIISPALGDLTAFVVDNQCGMVVDADAPLPKLERVSYEDKERYSELARKHFLKGIYWDSYATMFNKRS